MGDALLSMLRYICGLVDSVIYTLISKLYDLFIDTASLILYSQDAMDAIGKRIGLILGIVMLFRLAISLMSYLISPDTISDKSKGGSKIVTNIIISLILLVTINPIFEQAYKVQIKLVQSRFVEKIFFGAQANIPEVDIAYSLYSSFLTPDPQECKDLFDPYVGVSETCSNQIRSITNHKISEAFKTDIMEKHNLTGVLNNYDVINYRLNGYYFFDYFMIVSTLAGAIVALMLITFCMDLATRAVKLLFLQIIAPIPIIANVDPSKGSDIFKKWIKECITTYVSLFVRLILINFAVFMMTLIQTEFHDIFSQGGALLKVLIIIGCLMFAKQAPKLIENITGIKSDGFTLNPIKKFQEQALFGKQITGLAKGLGKGATAGAIGIGSGAIGAGIASSKLGDKWWQTGGATLRGAARGLVGGISNGYKSKTGFDAIKTGFGRLGTEADYVNSLDETDFFGRAKAGLAQRFHVATEADKTKKKIDALGAFDNAVDLMLKRSEAESVKHNDLQIKDSSGKMLTMEQHKQEQEKLNALRNSKMNFGEFSAQNGLMSYKDFADQKGGDFKENRADYEKLVNEVQEKFKKYELDHSAQLQTLSDKINKDTKIFATEYATQVTLGKYDDGETNAYATRVEETREELGRYYDDNELENKFEIYAKDSNGQYITDSEGKKVFSGANAKQAKQNAVTAKYETENVYNSKDGKYNIYQRQKANAAATKPKGK